MTLPFHISQRTVFYALAGLILLLAAITIVGDRGAIHLWRLRGEKSKIDEQNYRLQKENEMLRQRVFGIRNDNHYLEKLAREELNMVRQGEVIYRFPNSERERSGNNSVNDATSHSRPSRVQR